MAAKAQQEDCPPALLADEVPAGTSSKSGGPNAV